MAANLNQDGFAIYENVFSRQEIADLVSYLESAALNRSRAGARHLLSDAKVNAFACDPRLTKIALEADCMVPFRATLFDKSPESNWLVSWHQDTALPIRHKVETMGWGPWSVKDGIDYGHAPTHVLQTILALRIQLDDSTPENGPLRVIPGSHKRGVMSDDEVAEVAENAGTVECLGRVGSVIAMRPLIIHASSKSKNDKPRRVLHIEYAVSLGLGEDLTLAIA